MLLTSRHSLLALLFALELITIAMYYAVVLIGYNHDDLLSAILSILLLTIGASEIAIGLALVVAYQEVRKSMVLSEKAMLMAPPKKTIVSPGNQMAPSRPDETIRRRNEMGMPGAQD